ncbi:MAG: hypothetical protein CM15mP77_2290 [Synechococcus sp.]|nr:MAG: hypothetical protein CM15mP77_2290 [Synechococcus sp.]
MVLRQLSSLAASGAAAASNGLVESCPPLSSLATSISGEAC